MAGATIAAKYVTVPRNTWDGTEKIPLDVGGADGVGLASTLKTYMSASPTLVTPTIGVAIATSINKVAITAPATSATLTLIDGTTLTGPAASGTAMTLGNAEAVSGIKTFATGQIVNGTLRLGTISSVTGQLLLANSASANLTTIQAGNAAAARTYTWPTNFGAAGTVLTDAAGNGTLSWAAAGGGITEPLTLTRLLTITQGTANEGILASTGYSLTGSNATNMIDLAGTWNTSGAPTGIKLNITNTASGSAALFADLQIGGISQFSIGKFGNITFGPDAGGTYLQRITFPAGNLLFYTTSAEFGMVGGSAFRVAAALGIGWSSADTTQNADLLLMRDAASILAQRNATNAQTLRVYNTYTDASNYERGVFDWTTTANTLTVGVQAAGTGTARNMALVGALITIPGIASDATHTDSSICQDTTTHALYSGSGTLGICLGTSSIRFKEDVTTLNVGLKEILALEPVSYRYKDSLGIAPGKTLYGFTAEQGETVLPKLTSPDAEGRPQSFDYMGVVPVLVSAMKEQQEMIEALSHAVEELRATRH